MSDLFGTAWWSNTELAEVFGISPQRLGVLCRQGTVPMPENGLHDPKISVAAYIRHLKTKDEGASKADEEVKKLMLENEMRSIRLQRIAGELVPLDRVQRDWFESGRRVRDGLLNLPSRLSGVFAAESSQDKIFDLFTKEVHSVLTDLSSRQTGQPVTELLPLEEATMPEQRQQDAPHRGEPVVDEQLVQDGEPDRFSTGD